MGILNKIVDIGAMDRQITLHSLAYTTGASGEQVPSTETSETLWAKVDWKYGDEKEEAGRDEMNTRIEFTIRYYTGLTNKYWIEYESEKHDIINISELGRGRFHKILTERRV